MTSKYKILFLCTHNSARSILGEALTRHLFPNRVESFSAGTEASQVRELTLEVLREINISTENLSSKSLKLFLDESFDYVITVCDDANETCPVFYGTKKRIHWSLSDPSKVTGSREKQLVAFRNIREEIKTRIIKLLDEEFIQI